MRQTSLDESKDPLSDLAPSLHERLPIDHSHARRAIRHLLHKQWGCEVQHCELDATRHVASVQISKVGLLNDTIDGYARALAVVSGYQVHLRTTEEPVLESFASPTRTTVQLPRGLRIGVSEDSPVHPEELRSFLAIVRREVGLDCPERVRPVASRQLVEILDEFPDLRWILPPDQPGTLLIQNELSVIQQPWFPQLLQALDDYQASFGAELPIRVKLSLSDRDLWNELTEIFERRGIARSDLWKFEVNHDRARIIAHVQDPESIRESGAGAELAALTGYHLTLRKVPAELERILAHATLVVRPLDPWENLRRGVYPEQLASIRGLIPEAILPRRIEEQHGCVVVEYLRHDVPQVALKALTRTLERVGCLVCLVSGVPRAPLEPVAGRSLERMMEVSLPEGYLFQELVLTAEGAQARLLRCNALEGGLKHWKEEFERFMSPGSFTVQVRQTTETFTEFLSRATSEARRFYGRTCNEAGELEVRENLAEILRDVCGVDRYSRPQHRIEHRERLDLTNVFTFSIDPPETRFREDAASVQIRPDGFSVWVHVADLASFIPPGSPIEVPARERLIESVSLIRRERMPLYHRKFLLEEVSLDAGIARSALSVQLDFNEKGKIVGGAIAPSLVKNKLELTYNDCYGERAQSIPVIAQEALSKILLAVNVARSSRGERPISEGSTYDLIGELLTLSDGVVTEYFRSEGLLNQMVADKLTPTFRRVGREFLPLMWQQIAYSHEFGLPGPAAQDLERAVADWHHLQRTQGNRKEEFDQMERAVYCAGLVGSRVDGLLVALPHGRAGLEIPYRDHSLRARIVPTRQAHSHVVIDGLSCALGAKLTGQEVVGYDVTSGMLLVRPSIR